MQGLKLEPEEKVVFASTRGGRAAYSGLVWLGIFFVGMQGCGGMMTLGILASSSEHGTTGFSLMGVFWTVVGAALLVRWISLKVRPSFFVTDRRVVARRLFQPALSIPLGDLGGARRILVQMTRYGRVVNEINSHRVVVGVRNGTSTIGPVADVDELVSLINGIATRAIDPRLLGSLDGAPPRAEVRADVFFARSTVTAGAPRGPLFIGPTKVIGFAEVPTAQQEQQMFTVAGAEVEPAQLEENMVDLGQARICGRAVVMDREGATLLLEGHNIVLASGGDRVAFQLGGADVERAARYVKSQTSHGYRD